VTKIDIPRQYSDEEIIRKVLHGDIRLYEILIRRMNPFIYKIARSYGFNHSNAEDLMQDTFISAYYSLPNFEFRSSFKTWISRIMLNECHHKKKKASYKNEILFKSEAKEASAALFHEKRDTEKIIMNKELAKNIENALAEIPDDYRIVFTLRMLNGLSVLETQEVLNITESNVKVRLNRAKKMLKEKLELQYSSEDIYEFNLVYCDRVVERVMTKILTKLN
jgi:RNA polymerase sigma-70 factor (ECF subfamily)